MSDRATFRAALATNHAEDDARAAAIIAAKKLQISNAEAALVGGEVYNLLEADIEEVAVTDGGAVSLTVPATAVGAIVQVKMDTGFETSAICFTVDGMTPSLTASLKASHYETIDIGNSPNTKGDSEELGNFRAIAQAGETARIRVLYYEIV